MKPNLLFINTITIYGGGEVWMVNTMGEFMKKGFNVALLCKQGAEIIEHAEKAGIEVITNRFAGDLDPVSISNLVRILRKRKIDVAVTNTGKELRICGIAAMFVPRVKVVARQGIDYPLKNTFRYKFTYNKLADAILANSEATKRTMLKNAPWLNEEKIKVIYNGVNSDRYIKSNTKDLRNELGFKESDFIIGFVGRLNVQKGIEYMLKGFQLAKEKFPSAHLLIVGEGDLKETIKKFSSEQNLNDHIQLLGFREDISNIMRTIDILLLPSLWEGFGIVLIEAMAAGKPVVATNASSIPEIVEDGRNGFLVPPKNSVAISEALIKLINEPELRITFGTEGQKIVMEKFTVDRMINEYENIFKRLFDMKK